MPRWTAACAAIHENLERIRGALDAREFVLHYQPKVNMRTGAVLGVEALIRWQHPQQGLLPPAAFLPVVEEHPLAVAVGEWVIETALSQMELWQAAGLDMPVSVNVGARQLQQADFVERLRALLAAHPHVKSGDFELEVLETSALADLARVSQVIDACRGIGILCALDRLWHRLCLADLPQTPAGDPDQDRPGASSRDMPSTARMTWPFWTA